MKLVTTVILILFFSAVALANNPDRDVKVEVYKMGVVLDAGTDFLNPGKQDQGTKEKLFERVYPYRNYRVMKALHFLTRRSMPKLS